MVVAGTGGREDRIGGYGQGSSMQYRSLRTIKDGRTGVYDHQAMEQAGISAS